MIIYLAILIILACLGVKKSSSQDMCLKKEQTDAIKGLFIMIVFYCHIIPYLTSAGVQFSPILDIPANHLVCQRTGQLMVVMFLFYSGYGVTESIQSKGKEYIKSIPLKRILSTLINYDIAIVIIFIINLILGIQHTPKQYILTLIAWDSIGLSNWYIFAILYCYLASYISFSVNKNLRNAFLLTISLLLLYILLIVRLKGPDKSFWFNTIMAYPVGMAVSIYKKSIFSLLEKHYLPSLAVLTILFVLSFHYRSINSTVYQITSVIFAFLVFVITYKLVIESHILTWCGKNLFQIYIYQRLPMIVILHLFPQMVRLHPYFYLSCCLAITILLALAIKPISIGSKKRIP